MTPDPLNKPRVGIARCLLGDEVRYDGTHKRQADLLATLGPEVEWVPVCPEVEVGMGTPREPVELVSAAGALRMVGVISRRDWTDPMRTFASGRAAALEALGISGYIFKARSPSCALHGTRGLFADALVSALPGLPVADEEDLRDPEARARFLTQVRRYRG